MKNTREMVYAFIKRCIRYEKKLSGVYGGSYTSEIDVNAELLYGWRQGLRFN